MSQRLPNDAGPTADQMAQAAQELAWVLSAQRGDRQAFGKLAQHYQRPCVSVALRLLGNTQDAMELVQDALLKAYTSLSSLQQSERFGPWLMRIVTNMALNARRGRSRRQAISLEQTVGDEADGGSLRNQLPGGVAADVPLTSAELGEAIQEAMAKLPEKQRLALVLFAIEKMPQKEVAEILNCSVEAVKWHVFTARKQLRQWLGDYLED